MYVSSKHKIAAKINLFDDFSFEFVLSFFFVTCCDFLPKSCKCPTKTDHLYSNIKLRKKNHSQ